MVEADIEALDLIDEIRALLKGNDSQRKTKPESEAESYAQPQIRFGVSV